MAAIIFDFDGTIADSFKEMAEFFHELIGGEQPIDAQEIERLRGMSLHEAARELHIHTWQLPLMTIRGRRRMTKRMKFIAIHSGLPEVIQELQAAGHQLYITSSNSRHNIELFLNQHQLQTAFVKIYGSAGLLRKAHVLKKVIRQNHLVAADSWYIGDEIRDITAAKHAGLHSIAVGWGFNTPAVLKQHHPDHLVTRPTELMNILQKNI